MLLVTANQMAKKEKLALTLKKSAFPYLFDCLTNVFFSVNSRLISLCI